VAEFLHATDEHRASSSGSIRSAEISSQENGQDSACPQNEIGSREGDLVKKSLLTLIVFWCAFSFAQSTAGGAANAAFPPNFTPSQVFLDTFNNGLDTNAKWNATAGGNGVAPTNGGADAGSTVLNSGTTANSFSLLQSQSQFQTEEPGYNFVTFRNNLQSPFPTTGYIFWGLGITPASPTIANPVIDGCGFDITTAGHLRAVCYAGTSGTTGTVSFNVDLTTTLAGVTCGGVAVLPADTNAHKYYVWFSGSSSYWAIDGLDSCHTVANFQTGASGPSNNTLPLTAVAISNTGAAVTLTVNGVALGDTARNGIYSIASDNPAAGIIPIKSSSIESGHVLKAMAGNLYAVYATTTATGILMVFNSTTVPGDGAVTPIECIPCVLNGSIANCSLNFAPGPPEVYTTGISVAFSTGTSCVTKTASATAFFHAQVK
jgi:hypothetical protein